MHEIDRRNLPAAVLERLAGHTDGVSRSVPVNNGSESLILEVRNRRHPLELRTDEDGNVGVEGYATVYEAPYDVAGGAPYGWIETIARGAADKSVDEKDDVRFLVNHEGVALARTKSGTMTLTSNQVGLHTVVPSLDVARNPTAQELASALDRGDLDEMSFAFRVIRQEWNDDYTERRILELKIYDVSAVTYPANPATHLQVRDADPKTPAMSLRHARTIADQLRLPA